MQIAPSTYYKARDKEPSTREQRDQQLMPVLLELWVKHRSVFGAAKLAKAANKIDCIDIGRDQTARLMKLLGIQGVSKKRKKVKTTKSDGSTRAPDLVDRQFEADKPNDLWVTDLTYVPTRAGMAYVCFILDVHARYIVGWTVAGNMKTEMVLDALEMAANDRDTNLKGLRLHSDAGSQAGFKWWSQHY